MQLQGRQLIMLGADDWGRHPSSSQHIARVLSQHNRVLWVDSIGMRRPRLSRHDLARGWKKLVGPRRAPDRGPLPGQMSHLAPLAVPFHGSPTAERINRWLVSRQVVGCVRRLRMDRPILWFTSPIPTYLLDCFPGARVIYYVADDYAAHYPDYATTIRAKEAALLRRADLVLAASTELLQAVRGRHANAHLLSHGVDYDHFTRPACSVPADLSAVPHPRVGYVGWIRELIDLDLFSLLAASHPEWSLVLIGEADASVRSRLDAPNVHWLGRKAYQDLPGYLAGLDVGLVPYRYTEVTLRCNPLKLREYLASGIPVVSYDYPAVRPYADVIRIATTRQGFAARVEESLRDTGAAAVAGRRARVRRESWSTMVEGISPVIVEALRAARSAPCPHGSVTP